MTLQEAYNFFENLKNETSKKSELKIYEKFLHILTELKSKEFSKDQTQSLEQELDSLQLVSNPENRNKYFRKAFSKFEQKLRDTFALIVKGYYTNMGIGLGSSFGIVFGIVFLSSLDRSLGIALGLSIGTSIGLIIGRSMDNQALRENRVL